MHLHWALQGAHVQLKCLLNEDKQATYCSSGGSQQGLADLLRYTHIGEDHEDWQTAYSDFNRGYAQYTSYLT